MILVVGGLASGKREYLHALGYADSEIAEATVDDRPTVVEAQELVRAESAHPAAIAEALAAKDVVACREVGSGIVPLDAGERAWRERAGELSRELAKRAHAVVRMTCGIPQALKGDLPDRHSVELVMLRHGSTAESERRAYTGWLDVPLSPCGESEALARGTHPELATVYVSPSIRARQTAQLRFPNATQLVRDGLREMNFGAFEGRTADEMADDAAYRAWVDGNCEGSCPSGENRAALIERTSHAIRGIVRETVARGENRAGIVAHGGTIMAAMEAFACNRRDYFSWSVEPCEGYRAIARFENGKLLIERERRFAADRFPALRDPGATAHPAGQSFFQNRACPYFPCHDGVDEREFNCLFCYCPLYTLGPACGGNFSYTARGRKNCTNCTLPHQGEQGAQLVAANYEKLAALARNESVSKP